MEIAFHCEMTNNATMMLEITVGAIAATILSVFFYRRQETQRKKIDEIITNQESLRKKRIEHIVADLSVYLHSAREYINDARKARNSKTLTEQQKHELVNKTIFAKIDLENASRTIRNSDDILEPELLTRIRNVIRAGMCYSEMGFFPDTDEEDTTYDFDANWSNDVWNIIESLGKIL
ncbi:MAG: hypothetical protein WAO91_02450 [Candidatus Nitrosotenuis sp.]